MYLFSADATISLKKKLKSFFDHEDIKKLTSKVAYLCMAVWIFFSLPRIDNSFYRFLYPVICGTIFGNTRSFRAEASSSSVYVDKVWTPSMNPGCFCKIEILIFQVLGTGRSTCLFVMSHFEYSQAYCSFSQVSGCIEVIWVIWEWSTVVCKKVHKISFLDLKWQFSGGREGLYSH